MAQDTEDKRDYSSEPNEDNRGSVKVSQAMSMPPKQKSKLLTWLMVIIILLAIIFAGLLGWIWWRDRNQNANQDSTEPSTNQQQGTDEEPVEEVVCTDGFTIYTNNDVGIQFCYPTAWGEPSVADAKFAAADTGSRWLINFDSNNAVHAGLVSADWTTEVPRDGTCVDSAAMTMPTTSPFSTAWTTEATEGDTVSSAMRGVDMDADTLLISEYVDSLLTNGVCLEGYKAIDNPVYAVASASYYAEFNGTITTSQQHMDSPDTLISADDRDNFATFVESIVAFEE